MQAFDIKRLTNTFYRAYAGLFHRTNERCQERWYIMSANHQLLTNPDQRWAFTQHLLNELILSYVFCKRLPCDL